MRSLVRRPSHHRPRAWRVALAALALGAGACGSLDNVTDVHDLRELKETGDVLFGAGGTRRARGRARAPRRAAAASGAKR